MASGGVLSPHDATTPRRGSTRAKSKRTPQANRAARRRRRRGAATAARPGSCAGGSQSRLDGVMKKDAAARQHGKRKRDGSSQRRVRRQEAGQDRNNNNAQREFQRARAARRRAVGAGALPGQRPARHARALVDVVGVARGRVDVGVPAVPIAIQHHRAGCGPDSSAGARRTRLSCHNNVVRGAGACRIDIATSLRRRPGVAMGPGLLI